MKAFVVTACKPYHRGKRTSYGLYKLSRAENLHGKPRKQTSHFIAMSLLRAQIVGERSRVTGCLQ